MEPKKNQPMKSVRVRDEHKVLLVSPETHARFKRYAQQTGYKMQYIADIAIEDFLNRKEEG